MEIDLTSHLFFELLLYSASQKITRQSLLYSFFLVSLITPIPPDSYLFIYASTYLFQITVSFLQKLYLLSRQGALPLFLLQNICCPDSGWNAGSIYQILREKLISYLMHMYLSGCQLVIYLREFRVFSHQFMWRGQVF